MPSSTQPPLTESSILSSYLLNPSPLPQILSFSEFVKTCVPQQHRDHPHVKRLYRDLQFQRDIDVDAVRQNIERECRKSGILRGRLAAKIASENDRANETANKKRKRATSTSDLTSRASGPSGSAPKENQNGDLLPDEDDQINDATNVQVSETIHDAGAHPATSSLPVAPERSKFVPKPTHHTTSSLLESLERSISSLKQEKDDLDAQNDKLLQEMHETVGQLSDLRYGRFSKPLSGDGTGGDQSSFEDGIVEALQQLETAARRAIDRSST